MAVEITSAIAAVSPWPSSMSFSAWDAQVQNFLVCSRRAGKRARKGPSSSSRSAGLASRSGPAPLARAHLPRTSSPDGETHHHVGNLHAGIVDVVLDFDVLAAEAQQAHKGVAQNGVAQVADVRGLVGIDAGVFDQDFAVL